MKLWTPILLALLGAATHAAAASPVAGEWRGAIQTPDGDLPVIVRLVEDKAGLSGGLVAPSQSPDAIPLKVTDATAAHLALTLPSIAASFTADWKDDQKAWAGTWSQSGLELPLVLRRAP